MSPRGLPAPQLWLLAAFCLLVAWVCFSGLGSAGLLGPDEPRYAFIGRAMARSGDWLTPRLWGEPWFEKPPLTYWLAAAAFRLGLSEDLAPRVPVAALSVLFLALQWILLRRMLDARIAWLATLLNASTAAWIAYSMVGVTDLPLAVFFHLAVLLAWLETTSPAPPQRYAAAACLAAATLAKGLVPIVLFLPMLWFLRKQWRAWAGPFLLFLLLAAPWYAAMTVVHGRPFLDEFFLRHHFSRFSSEELQHVQPFWFYAPVLAGGLFPWIPALLALRPALRKDLRLRIPLAVFLFGFLFFSISRNKLPGYLLPLWPSFCILAGAGLAASAAAGRPLFWTVMLAGLCQALATLLPEALLYGITRASVGGVAWEYFAALLPLALAAWWLDSRGRRLTAAALAAVVALAGFWFVRVSAAPVLDQVVSARGLWRRIESRKNEVCIDRLHRAWRYGLAYYAGAPVPDCSSRPLPLRIDQEPDALPKILPNPGATLAPLPGAAASTGQ